jgi:hypothetical protein
MAVKITKADKFFSLLVRNRDGWKCSVCGTQYAPEDGASLQCSHFIGRANKAVRFDPDNASAKCAACHFRMEGNPLAFAAWIAGRLGNERLSALVARSIRAFKFNRAMQAHITKRLQQSWHIASMSELREFPSPYPPDGELPDSLVRKPKARKAKPATGRGMQSRGFDKTRSVKLRTREVVARHGAARMG